MTETESYTAVVDRFEGDDAILVAERRDDVVDADADRGDAVADSSDSGPPDADRDDADRDGGLVEFVVPRAILPADARHPDAVLELTVEADAVTVVYRPDETGDRRERARERFERLARRPPRDPPD